MKETRIMLASVLKPVNDPRMFSKLGLSLASLPHIQVHILGYQAPVPAAPANIVFHPIFNFKRLGVKRFLAPYSFFKLLLRVSPQVLIVCTHELLLSALIYKIFRPCQLIYDVRENYYLNLTSQRIYSPFVSRFLANCIRFTEKFAARFTNWFFLAEKSYARELTFLQNKFIILQNKYKPASLALPVSVPFPGRVLPPDRINLLYSGTISHLYGVFRAINLCEALNQVKPIFSLTIIGYCAQPVVLQEIKARIAGHAAITLFGGDELVPHDTIIAAVLKSHMGLLPYYPHPSTFNCIPTKLFEYLGHALPILVQQNPLWEDLLLQYDAGLAIDFADFNATALFRHLTSRTYYQGQDLSGVYWQSEEAKLLQWMEKTISTT